MNKLSNAQQFIMFCLEAYRKKNKMQGKQALELFEHYNIIDFLESGYEVLHTQSINYVISEIQELINNKQ